ncbi:hypothetical protein V1478_008682 [Vespula squamosa]|uniref:Uncharacterized protein n=1 Tax=Vespula squamosa TaxID=30214 RepID=A0ABD2AU77_VESSQ
MLLSPTEAQNDYIVDLLSPKGEEYKAQKRKIEIVEFSDELSMRQDASTDGEHETYGEGGVKEGGAWDQSSRFTAVITKITAPHNDEMLSLAEHHSKGLQNLILAYRSTLTKVLLRGALGGCRKVSQTLRLYLGGLMKAIVRLIRNCELLRIFFGVSRILGFKLCTENLALRIFCQIVKSEKKTLNDDFENIGETFMEILDNTVTPAVIADVTFNERNQCRL